MIGLLVVDGTELDLSERVPFPLNYSIADAKEPQKRKRNYSKEIVLPGTQKNLSFFSSTYQLALSTLNGTSTVGFNYDPTIRISAKYYNGGVLIFNGLIRLNEVAINDGDYSFKCTMFSNFIDLFMSLGDRKISELGWSEYTHTLNRTNVINSFDTSVIVNGVATANFSSGLPMGFGYHYGLVDYGYSRVSPKTFSTTDLVPMVYCKEVMDKCLELSANNITYSSDYLDSDLFKKELLGFGGGEKVALTASEVANRRVNITAEYNNVNSFNHVSKQAQIYKYLFSYSVSLLADWDGCVPTLIHDNFDQFFFDHNNTANGFFQGVNVRKQGLYNMNASFPLRIAFDNFGNQVYTGGFINVRFTTYKNGSVLDTYVVQQTSLATLNQTFAYDYNVQLNAGDVIYFGIQVYADLTLTQTAPAVSVNNPLIITIENNPTDFTLDFTSVQTSLQDGDPVDISRFIPDMKASTFFEAQILKANLYFSDPDKLGVVTVEPLSDFYLDTDTFWDITDIIDHSKEITIKPSSSIEGKVYKFQWLNDNDYDNTLYRSYFDINYGDNWYVVPSTFQTGQRVYQLPFAQSIPTDEVFPFIAPRIVSYDPATDIKKPFKGKPRLYLWNGLKSGSWRLKDTIGTGKTDLTSYPCVHHFDNFENPAFDLNWGLPILFAYNATSVTTDNLYTRYHERFVKEITGKDSKIVTLYARITNADINKLNFAKLIMVNGVLFRLNLISDFDSNVTDSTKIELVKIIEASATAGGGLSTYEEMNYLKSSMVSSPNGVGIDTDVISGGYNDTLQYSQIIYTKKNG